MFPVRGGPCFKYHKANSAIRLLDLSVHGIGNDGAGLLAEALKAMLATLLASSAHNPDLLVMTDAAPHVAVLNSFMCWSLSARQFFSLV